MDYDEDINLLPMLPLRDIVVFPHMVIPLFVGRKHSKRVIEAAIERDSHIFCITQRDESKDHPRMEDLYEIGTIVRIPQVIKLPDGCFKVLVEGVSRACLRGVDDEEIYKRGLLQAYPELPEDDRAALSKVVMSRFNEYAELTDSVSQEVIAALSSIRHTGRLCDLIAVHLPIDSARKQEVLGTLAIEDRVEKVVMILSQEIEWMQIDQRIHSRVKKSISKDQENYFKNQKLRAIQEELGEDDMENGLAEAEKLKQRIEKLGLADDNKEKVLGEVNRLKLMPPMSAEATVIRSYVEWVLDLPWKKKVKPNKDLEKAMQVLNDEHYGLKEVKERIIESIAVNNRVKTMKGPILCLVGPPGVGKTSLGQSIAKATGRPFVRISLGGVRDESEIRGHRKTYIGAMPGRIIKAMKKAKVTNPLIMLDEIDKMGSDFRGDPASALLEVLDPEQNAKFSDHYLEMDYNLSDVLFLTTANSMHIPLPLLDRMEVIRIAGYTENEKMHISKSHLLKKNIAYNGLKAKEISLDDDVLLSVINDYTREAGVRELDRCVSKICRKVVTQLSQQATMLLL